MSKPRFYQQLSDNGHKSTLEKQKGTYPLMKKCFLLRLTLDSCCPGIPGYVLFIIPKLTIIISDANVKTDVSSNPSASAADQSFPDTSGFGKFSLKSQKI